MNIYFYKKELTVAKMIAKKAGVIMCKHFFDVNQKIGWKKDHSAVTLADTQINTLVIKELKKHFKDGIIGEEESTAGYGMGRRWFCDPVDGTKAFTWGVPTAMFSLGLVVDGMPVMGVVYDPFLDLIYEGVKGGASYCNGKRLHVSKKDIAGQYVAVTSTVEKLMTGSLYIRRLIKQKARLGTFSGAVYKSCLVARGKFVGYLESSIGPYDIAAAQVIVEEAGGKVTGFDGKRLNYARLFHGAIVSNGVVHAKLLASLKNSR